MNGSQKSFVLSQTMQNRINMKVINEDLLNQTTSLAKTNPRRRMNYNFHEKPETPINRLLNAMEPDTYVRPHRHLHPAKEEIFLILRGKALLLLFDAEGNITETLLLNPLEGSYGAELMAGVWHGLLVLESGTVLYEIKNGPFTPLATEDMAPWSPAAEETEEVQSYMKQLKQQLSLP
ncbi:cupin fold WbuC family metalloprotein [Parabacteroides sp. PM5-20]|nr:cupin fold WbuC family metalloprotein [Parabacteroides sp. PM5-20]